MSAVLISIQPKWCELIASGIKTKEVRKTRPKLETPFKVYIYETNWKDNSYYKVFHEKTMGKVIGEFVCDSIGTVGWISNPNKKDWKDGFNEETCLTNRKTYEYTKGEKFYEWLISNLVIYDEPKELSEFKKINRECWYADLGLAKRDCPECQNKGCFVQRPPQSWCYVEEMR